MYSRSAHGVPPTVVVPLQLPFSYSLPPPPCCGMHMCWRIHKQWQQQENREDPTIPTLTHTRIMTKNAFCGTVDMLHPPPLPPLQLLGSPISGWFIMQKLCKDKQNYEPRQQPAFKNSTATLSHILLHKASHISPTLPLSLFSSQSDSRSAVTIHPFPLPNPFPNFSFSFSFSPSFSFQT